MGSDQKQIHFFYKKHCFLTTAVEVPAPREAQLRIRDSATKAMILKENSKQERERERAKGMMGGKDTMQMNQFVFVAVIVSLFLVS